MNKKIVVLNGSFNPVTNAHLETLLSAKSAVSADLGIFVPVPESYIKSKMILQYDRLSLSNDIRLKMLKALCNKYEGLDVCEYEIQIDSSEYTYKTFMYIKKNNPNSDIYYVMGADKLRSIPYWKSIEKFLSEFNFIVFDRADINAYETIMKNELLSKYSDKFNIIPALENLSDVSATKVRELFLNNDLEFRKYLDNDVADILDSINLDDYPIVSDYDWISVKLKSGPFGVTAACKKVYELNKSHLKTLDLSNQINNMKYEFTEVKANEFKCSVEIKNDDCSNLVSGLKADGYNPAIIVESSSFKACGGYDGGANNTLEEQLCLTTSLSSSLYSIGNPKYKAVREAMVNKCNLYPRSPGSNIYIPGVKFLRYPNGNYELLKEDITCDIISSSSLSFTKMDKENHLNSIYCCDGRLTDSGKEIYTNGLRNAFRMALSNNNDSIIINAFGSGFHLPLDEIASLMSEVITECKNMFKLIIINVKPTKRIKNEFLNNLNL